MSKTEPHRKRIKHFHQAGDLHEFTFSCYHRKKLLSNNVWRESLARAIDKANREIDMRLVAFVFMPEHVHLLVYPARATFTVDDIPLYLKSIKLTSSVRVKRHILESRSRMLDSLTVRERPGRTVFRFWQEGPGYDRNLNTERSFLASIDYIHMNPVRRGLCKQARDWFWSSARWYVSNTVEHDSRLPQIDGLPPEFFAK